MMAGLALVPLFLALFLCFVAGANRSAGRKWRRFVAGALVFVCIGWLMAALAGFAWGCREVQKYYDEIFRELVFPRPPAHPAPHKPDKKILKVQAESPAHAGLFFSFISRS